MVDLEDREEIRLRRVRGPRLVRLRGGTPVTSLGGSEDLDLGRHRWIALVGLFAVAGLFLLTSFAIGTALRGGGHSGSVARVSVPRVDGSSLEAASRSLGALGLLVAVEYQPNEAVAQGMVFGQRPIAGSKLEVGSEVTLVVSDGAAGVKVPDVKGFQQSEAVKLLQANQLTPNVELADDESVRPGEVLRTDPAAGVRADPGATIRVYVSNGPAPRTVPAIGDQPIAQGFAALGRSGVGLGAVTTQAVDGKPPGVIVSTDPPAGASVSRGFPIAVVVTPDGPDVTVPSVTGLLSSSATSALSGKGFVVSTRSQSVPYGDARAGRVIAQSVPAGSSVVAGLPLQLTVAVAQAPPTTTTTAPQATTTSVP